MSGPGSPPILEFLPQRVGEIIDTFSQTAPERVALLGERGVWTYQQLHSAMMRSQQALHQAGVRPGDRVMIVCENCLEFAALYFAVTNLNAWPVLANARLSPREIDQIRDHCQARRILYTVSVSPRANNHAQRHGAERLRIPEVGEIAVGSLCETVHPEPLDPKASENVAAVIYTSGTTGLPKGVMLTHRNILFIAEHSARIRSITCDDRLLGILPMSHAVGFSVVLLGSLIRGASVYLSSRFDPREVVDVLENHGITIVLGAPSMFAILTEYAKMKGLKSLKTPSLRLISSSGAPLPLGVKQETEKLFGLVLHNGYGITECSPTIALTRVDAPRIDTAVGRVFPDIEIKITSHAGNSVDAGEVGELWVRGPNVMKGYYRAPEETAAAIDQEGWYKTGDLARMEDDHLFIVGRTDERIVRFGFNVYPVEVEAVLDAHPDVVRSAVVGRVVGHEEEVLAFVQLAPGSSVTASDIAKHAAENLAPYKRPAQIIFVSELPLTLTGKVVKADLSNR